MTPTEIDEALDAMHMAAAGNPDLMPVLITVESNHWVQVVSGVRPTCARLDDDLRHRDVQIHVGSGEETKLLTRVEAGEQGEPYRDLMPTT